MAMAKKKAITTAARLMVTATKRAKGGKRFGNRD
jgi:hypothetical protein